MPIIDCQVHAYEANTPARPWANVPNWPDRVTGDEMVAAMDAVGVDGAILVSAFSLYQFDASYAVEVHKAHPGKFGLVKPMDASDPDVADVVAEWKATPGTVAVRIMMDRGDGRAPDYPGFDRILKAAAAHGFPVNLLCWGDLDRAAVMIARHPNTQFVIDHIGIVQPRELPVPDAPWADLPKVIDLAKHENAVIKISGAGTLSKAGYPYPDIWDPLAQVFDAWTIDRCLWGTDWTRAAAILSYEQGVEPFTQTDRLTDAERATLMGGACARVYNWSPTA